MNHSIKSNQTTLSPYSNRSLDRCVAIHAPRPRRRSHLYGGLELRGLLGLNDPNDLMPKVSHLLIHETMRGMVVSNWAHKEL